MLGGGDAVTVSARKALYQRTWRALRWEKGICSECLAPRATGESRCEGHNDVHTARMREWRRGQYDKGLCANCTRPRVARHTRCRRHRQIDLRMKANRVENLLCPRCNRRKSNKQQRCPTCLVIERAYHRRRRAVLREAA